jgi:hypothetical protein
MEGFVNKSFDFTEFYLNTPYGLISKAKFELNLKCKALEVDMFEASGLNSTKTANTLV